MKNNGAKLGCLQLVMRNIIPSSSRENQNDDVTQEPKKRTKMPLFGYDPLSLGVPCNNSVRYDPFTPARQCEKTTELFSQASYSSLNAFDDSEFDDIEIEESEFDDTTFDDTTFDDTTFDDSAWESIDSYIDDAIEREVRKENQNEEYFDIETGLMNLSFAGETKSWLDTLHVPKTPTEIPTQGDKSAWSVLMDKNQNETYNSRSAHRTDFPICVSSHELHDLSSDESWHSMVV